MAYKNARLMAVTADVLQNKLDKIASITNEPSTLPDVDVPPPNFPQE